MAELGVNGRVMTGSGYEHGMGCRFT